MKSIFFSTLLIVVPAFAFAGAPVKAGNLYNGSLGEPEFRLRQGEISSSIPDASSPFGKQGDACSLKVIKTDKKLFSGLVKMTIESNLVVGQQELQCQSLDGNVSCWNGDQDSGVDILLSPKLTIDVFSVSENNHVVTCNLAN